MRLGVFRPPFRVADRGQILVRAAMPRRKRKRGVGVPARLLELRRAAIKAAERDMRFDDSRLRGAGANEG